MPNLLLKAYVKTVCFFKDKEGASAIEYAIIAGLIAVVFMVAAGEVGTQISTVFESVRDKLSGT